jgi:hypothetical protein
MMHPDGYFIRQLDRLGQCLVDAHGLLAVPLLGGWLARKGTCAYHRGFVAPLAADPRQTILSVIHTRTTGDADTTTDGVDEAHPRTVRSVQSVRPPLPARCGVASSGRPGISASAIGTSRPTTRTP